jgi:hypothetical protein
VRAIAAPRTTAVTVRPAHHKTQAAIQAAVAEGQTFRTPERFDGASEMPELIIGTPAGVFSIFEFDERIDETREFQSIAAGFLGMRAVVFVAAFIVFSLGFESAERRPHAHKNTSVLVSVNTTIGNRPRKS